MKTYQTLVLAAMITTTGLPQANAGTVSPVQSSATPFGLQPIADVQLAGSDADAADFSENALPDLQAIVSNTLTESQTVGSLSSIALNPNDLIIAGGSSVRAYFIGEGAGYRNSLGVYTGESSDALTGDASLIFPDASTSSSYLNPTESSYRSTSVPVAAGDFVDLGTFTSDTQLNLFLISNGANGGSNTFYTDSALNSDSLAHFVVLATPDSPYLLIGAEDLPGGGDMDYNDVVIALDVGIATASKLISKAVPLPAPLAALLGPVLFLVLSAWKRRRRSLDYTAHAV